MMLQRKHTVRFAPLSSVTVCVPSSRNDIPSFLARPSGPIHKALARLHSSILSSSVFSNPCGFRSIQTGSSVLSWFPAITSFTGASICCSMSRVSWYSEIPPTMVRSPQCMRTSAAGSGSLKAWAELSCCWSNGVLCVSEMIRMRVGTMTTRD